MSAQRWFIPVPGGKRKETTDFNEVRAFLREKQEERRQKIVQVKTPPPPRFAEPAHRAPQMRVSQR